MDDRSADLKMTPPASRRCSTCAEPLSPQAKKCVKCATFQDWRRFFGLPQTVLALLTALLSVIFTGVPPLYRLFQPPNSDVRASSLSCEKTRLQVVVTNVGERPAVIKTATLTVWDGATRLHDRLKATLRESESDEPMELLKDPVLEAGKTRLLIVENGNAIGAPFPADGAVRGCKWTLSLGVVPFEHSTDQQGAVVAPCACPRE